MRIQVKKNSEGRNTEGNMNVMVSLLLSEWTQIFMKAGQSSSEFLGPGPSFPCVAILEQKREYTLILRVLGTECSCSPKFLCWYPPPSLGGD